MERGQVLERMTLVAVAGAELEGLWQSGAGVGGGLPIVLAAPHPCLGGNMDSPVLAEVVWSLARQRHPTLRFNWRGVGASAGERSDRVDDAVADLAAAVDQHAPDGPCGLVGYSFGAAVAARVAATHARVERVVLVAPALPIDFAALSSTGVAVAIFAGEDDPRDVDAAPFGVHRISRANHSFTAGLLELGRCVAECFPHPGA